MTPDPPRREDERLHSGGEGGGVQGMRNARWERADDAVVVDRGEAGGSDGEGTAVRRRMTGGAERY